jgi:hypothetical protein
MLAKLLQWQRTPDPEEDQMTNKEGEPDEQVGFWRGWTGLYIFVLIYGLVQIFLLYLFTLTLNRA